MEEIEVNIQLKTNNKIYNLPIRKSDTILKLKEYCKVISDIPQDQQNLMYKGIKLVNEKLISDYNIENDQTIILVKKEELRPGNVPINQNLNNINLFENCINNFKNLDFSNNKEVEINQLAKYMSKIPNFFSFVSSMDVNLINNLCHSIGIGKLSEMVGVEPQEMEKMLKDPSVKNIMNNVFKDPSSIEAILNEPIIRTRFLNNPLLKMFLQNPQIMMSPQNIQLAQMMFGANRKNPIENNSDKNSVPPDPFGNLNNNQINQIMNSLGQNQNINTFNNNSNARNEENYRNSEMNIDYKEEYKEQLTQLRNMGFTNEEANIQALKKTNGNIDRAVDKILEENN
jgi:ubiquilin